MKVKDIQVDGFGVWTGLSVDSLPEGMTLFYGPNEAGKTTLMQFVRAMLYGFTDDRRQRYLPPVYGGTPGGAMRVTGPGGGYEIRRHSQLTDADSEGRLSVTGQDGLAQGQHRLTALLGQIDEAIFTNVFAIGIRELQELNTLDDTSAADELYKLSSGLDRVSLVDVIRGLRKQRRNVVGEADRDENAQATKLGGLLARRQRLRDEVIELTRHGRRWSELATQRRSQRQEIDQLTERVASWEREARCVEVATSVYEHWTEYERLSTKISKAEAESQLPEEAPGQLVQIEALLEDRKSKLSDVKQKRREIRDRVDQLPVSRQMLELQGRIQAATEQATWIEALEEQVERLDGQIDKARRQVDSDAEQLGLDEEERARLGDGEAGQLPDLSKQTLAALSGPAKKVREQLFLLKQSRGQANEHKERADKAGTQLQETLRKVRAGKLQQAIRDQNSLISTLRHRIQLGEHLEKLKRHYRELENESVDLTTDQVLPIDRLPMLGVSFIVGGALVLYGLFHIFDIELFIGQNSNPNQGMLCVLIGSLCLLVFYLSRERGQRSTSHDLEDCERQIDSIRRQIREIESEREDVESTLPRSGESLEQRLREAEKLLAELEAALPLDHQHQAAMEAYQAARQRASEAADGLKDARRMWSVSLGRLGLSESMSPSSVRELSGGYETLQASLRRLNELVTERDQRRRERQTIAKRIEALYLEATKLTEAPDQKTGAVQGDREARGEAPRPKVGPLDQLNHLQEELSRHQHWIRRRRELKEQDLQLKKQQSAHQRAIERAEQQRRGLWAKCGVATGEDFYQMVDRKASLTEMRSKQSEIDQRIRSMIGNHIDHDEVQREIDGASASDLDKRWESLTSRISETEDRIAHLRTAQGELSQEMKQLAEDGRLTVAQLELACVERKIESAARRWQILAVASSLLDDVCHTFERERQPETLREASSFLNQLTDGKYTRIWTPLGTNQLKVDDADSNCLSLELLSRGTGEAVFIALRLALAAAYARRGVMLPLVLDDVLVNFDRERAMHAALTLKTFAELGHQVMMFTCHEHIVEIFQEIGVEVRGLPPQGQPGRAAVLEPWEVEETPYEVPQEDDTAAPELIVQPVEELDVVGDDPPQTEELAQPAEPRSAAEEPQPDEEQTQTRTEPQHRIVYVQRPLKSPIPPETQPRIERVSDESLDAPIKSAPAIEWAWFEREPADGRIDEDEVAAEATRGEWIDDDHSDLINLPDDAVSRKGSWWNGNRVSA